MCFCRMRTRDMSTLTLPQSQRIAPAGKLVEADREGGKQEAHGTLFGERAEINPV
jgi:hypothetical protein